MAFKVFLDVNIILDFVLQRDGYKSSKTIITWAEEGKINGFVSPTVVQICSYWIAKAYGVKKAKEIMTTLLAFTRTIDTPHQVVLAALHSSINDIEDALQYYTALHYGMSYIISHGKAFQKAALPSLPVVSPTDFITIIS